MRIAQQIKLRQHLLRKGTRRQEGEPKLYSRPEAGTVMCDRRGRTERNSEA